MAIDIRKTQAVLAALAITIVLSAAGYGQATDPPIKKSRSGICHEKGSGSYNQTIHFQPFDSMANCLKSGGRRSKNAKPAKPSCDAPAPKAGDDGVFFGRVESVVDGDTFKAKVQGVVVDFRLSDIDAPEHDQPYGPEARAALSALLDKKDVVMQVVDNDPYSRFVVYAWVADLNVNRELMLQGAGWFDSQYAYTSCLYEFEQEARDAKRGMWALPLDKRIEPWIWRESKRDAAGDTR